MKGRRKPGRSLDVPCAACGFKPARKQNGEDRACKTCAKLSPQAFARWKQECLLITLAAEAGCATVHEYLTRVCGNCGRTHRGMCHTLTSEFSP